MWDVVHFPSVLTEKPIGSQQEVIEDVKDDSHSDEVFPKEVKA